MGHLQSGIKVIFVNFWYLAVRGTGTREVNFFFMKHHKMGSTIDPEVKLGHSDYGILRYEKWSF